MNYVNSIFRQILEDLPGEVTIINGRVRHPQSQGVVEKGNAKVEECLLVTCQCEKRPLMIVTSPFPKFDEKWS